MPGVECLLMMDDGQPIASDNWPATAVTKSVDSAESSGHEMVIDLLAVVGTLVATSGFILIFFLRLKRFTGIMTAGVGALLMWWMYVLATA